MYAFQTHLRRYRQGAVVCALALAAALNLAATAQERGAVDVEIKAQYKRPGAVPFPQDNPYSREKELLGRKLFFDTRLSRSNRACASCHQPSARWSDGLRQADGAQKQPFPRRTPTLLNAAWLSALMWDGRASSLEQQALMPIEAKHEMDMPLAELLKRLNALPDYQAPFTAAFGNVEKIEKSHIEKALATFERTLVSPVNKLDAWVDGDDRALTPQAQRGFALFNGKARCSACHSGWRLTDDSFHDIGLRSPDPGRGGVVPVSVTLMQYAFKTPTLRELAVDGPYMHDGSMDSLQEVVKHYETGGQERPSRSPEIKPFSLTDDERADLIAFLLSLRQQPDPGGKSREKERQHDG